MVAWLKNWDGWQWSVSGLAPFASLEIMGAISYWAWHWWEKGTSAQRSSTSRGENKLLIGTIDESAQRSSTSRGENKLSIGTIGDSVQENAPVLPGESAGGREHMKIFTLTDNASGESYDVNADKWSMVMWDWENIKPNAVVKFWTSGGKVVRLETAQYHRREETDLNGYISDTDIRKEIDAEGNIVALQFFFGTTGSTTSTERRAQVQCNDPEVPIVQFNERIGDLLEGGEGFTIDVVDKKFVSRIVDKNGVVLASAQQRSPASHQSIIVSESSVVPQDRSDRGGMEPGITAEPVSAQQSVEGHRPSTHTGKIESELFEVFPDIQGIWYGKKDGRRRGEVKLVSDILWVIWEPDRDKTELVPKPSNTEDTQSNDLVFTTTVEVEEHEGGEKHKAMLQDYKAKLIGDELVWDDGDVWQKGVSDASSLVPQHDIDKQPESEPQIHADDTAINQQTQPNPLDQYWSISNALHNAPPLGSLTEIQPALSGYPPRYDSRNQYGGPFQFLSKEDLDAMITFPKADSPVLDAMYITFPKADSPIGDLYLWSQTPPTVNPHSEPGVKLQLTGAVEREGFSGSRNVYNTLSGVTLTPIGEMEFKKVVKEIDIYDSKKPTVEDLITMAGLRGGKNAKASWRRLAKLVESSDYAYTWGGEHLEVWTEWRPTCGTWEIGEDGHGNREIVSSLKWKFEESIASGALKSVPVWQWDAGNSRYLVSYEV